ncbi:RNA ligase (ATP) [Deinococcus hopiensis]|uniref:RNA ligase, DRB0094 family n=1 Tax=Deinococcus hopiensis KR-140 TaxID=695939 RepID=A0A1W1UAJ6_9DEIO|nr:RNA ligase (ATP) [Deinococcus hopiensis]SMB78128.1 RNA ligase, DRB0094 family [Deinococcus hopiensis KR-140]
MAIPQVIKGRARLFPHTGAERLELCKVGSFQLVVRKGEYQDGDPIVVAPERALLPPHLAARYVNSETGASYLHGPEKNRVGAVRLRGELSQGVILPLEGLEEAPFGEDLSAQLGITFWEPPIPVHLTGEVAPLPALAHYGHHDVEQFGIYAVEFRAGEPVIATEKLHGTQGVYHRTVEGEWRATSKGLSRNRLTLKENEGNVYWQAARNSGLFGRVDTAIPAREIQVFGEVVPVQKGFSYGQRKPAVFVFKVLVDGEPLPRAKWPVSVLERSVPVLYEGPFEEAKLRSLRGGMETVSGRGLHIREGLVVMPVTPRLTADGRDLSLKLISEAYAKKETGEEFS